MRSASPGWSPQRQGPAQAAPTRTFRAVNPAVIRADIRAVNRARISCGTRARTNGGTSADDS
jgi:hypothetical protein